jgi:hypothetical protein
MVVTRRSSAKVALLCWQSIATLVATFAGNVSVLEKHGRNPFSAGVMIPYTWISDGIRITNLTKATEFTKSFEAVCMQKYAIKNISKEWDHNKICKSWTSFSQFGNFTDEDFKMYPPKHLIPSSTGVRVSSIQ